MHTLNNNPNNINYFEYTLLEENKKLKSINDNSRNILTKLSNENKNLKSQIKLLETDNNYIINIQKEMDQLINLIKENNITFNNDKINIEFEQKINNLQNILNNKEASLQNYEIQNNNNMDVNILIKEVQDKNKIIYELKNKIMNSEKQIRLLNQKLKNSNTNNNKLISQENHNLNIKLVDMEKENQFYKNKLEEMVNQINNIKKSDNGNNNILFNNSQEVINMANKTKNLEFKINQLNQEIFQLKKEKDILELTNNNLLSEIEKINQNKTSQNQNTNDIDISSAIKKKEEEIEGLNAFIQKLTKQSEKYSEDIETYKIKINSLQKENTSIKKQLERLTIEMPKELNALKIQLDEANKKLSENNNDFSNNKTTNSINKSNTKNKEKSNKAFDEGMQKEIENNMVTKLNKEISDLKNKNKELLFKLEDKEINILNSGYKTDEQNMTGYEEEFDLRKMATGARDKNRSEDINIDYPGLQNYKEKLNELQFKFNNLKEQIKILLSKIKCTNIIKPTFVQICQLLGYKSIDIEKMVCSEKEKKKILGV
jgi:chromosome segregation ATPase